VDQDGHQEGAGIRLDQDIKDYLAGRISKEEYMARITARATGAAVGVAIIASSRIAQSIFLWAATNPDKVQQIAAALQETAGGPPGAISGTSMMSKAELSMAQKLAAEGKNVEKLGESSLRGVKSADFLVDGVKVELKTLGSSATAATLKNDIAKAVGQGGGNVLIDARSAAVSLADAQKAAARVFGADPRLQVVRIVGKGFDATIARQAH
jgi:hypothetical protein